MMLRPPFEENIGANSIPTAEAKNLPSKRPSTSSGRRHLAHFDNLDTLIVPGWDVAFHSN